MADPIRVQSVQALDNYLNSLRARSAQSDIARDNAFIRNDLPRPFLVKPDEQTTENASIRPVTIQLSADGADPVLYSVWMDQNNILQLYTMDELAEIKRGVQTSWVNERTGEVEQLGFQFVVADPETREILAEFPRQGQNFTRYAVGKDVDTTPGRKLDNDDIENGFSMRGDRVMYTDPETGEVYRHRGPAITHENDMDTQARNEFLNIVDRIEQIQPAVATTHEIIQQSGTVSLANQPAPKPTEPEAGAPEAPAQDENAFPKTLEAFAALQVIEKLGQIDPADARTAYRDTNAALSYLQRPMSAYLADKTPENEAAVLEQLEKIPEGFQAIAVQYVGDSLESGTAQNVREYKAQLDNANFGGEYRDQAEAWLKAKAAGPQDEPEAAVQTEPEEILIQIPAGAEIQDDKIPDGAFDRHKYIADTAMQVMRSIERGATPEQLEPLIAQFEAHDKGFPAELQYGPALQAMANGKASYEAVTIAVSRRMALATTDLSPDKARDQILTSEEVATKLIDGHQFNYQAASGASVAMIERIEELGPDATQEDFAALIEIHQNMGMPYDLSANADPARAFPEDMEHMRGVIISARDPEVAREALLQDPPMSREAQLEKFGAAMVGDEPHMIRAPDGRAMVLWEVKDPVTGDADYVLRDSGSLLRDYNGVYLNSLDQIGDNIADARSKGQAPQNITAPIEGISGVAQDVSQSFERIRTLQADPGMDIHHGDRPDLSGPMAAAYQRLNGNEAGAEALESQMIEQQKQQTQTPQAEPEASVVGPAGP